MHDVGLFIFGCVVFTISGIGTFLFLYTKFRREFMRQNRRQLGVTPAPVRSRRHAGLRDQ